MITQFKNIKKFHRYLRKYSNLLYEKEIFIFVFSINVCVELEKREELHRRKIARERLEISLSEEHLGLTVDAVGDDERLVRFCFTRIDPTDWNRRFVIVLDVSASRSRVVSCDPPVPSLSRLLQTLNGDGLSGHLCRFLSELRSEFVSVALSVKT